MFANVCVIFFVFLLCLLLLNAHKVNFLMSNIIFMSDKAAHRQCPCVWSPGTTPVVANAI